MGPGEVDREVFWGVFQWYVRLSSPITLFSANQVILGKLYCPSDDNPKLDVVDAKPSADAVADNRRARVISCYGNHRNKMVTKTHHSLPKRAPPANAQRVFKTE
jgi:hypothetical protein